MLTDDPADISAQALLTISQRLLIFANGTELSGLAPPPGNGPIAFVPSRSAIWVNTLWYLSLSLSLATSFIAILSKDWFHSFMSGRTGQPYSQTCRRQQKWDMIERWKMSELIAVLPSLIHTALLLFCVGLSIYLLDTHIVVAIPVFCATGIAIGFYIWSSIAAVCLDHFPYPTIVSRLCSTNVVRAIFQDVPQLASSCFSYPLIRHAYQLTLMLVLLLSRALTWPLMAPLLLCSSLKSMQRPLDLCSTLLIRSHPLLQLVAIPLCALLRTLVCYPARKCHRWLEDLVDWILAVGDEAESRLEGAVWGFEWVQPDLAPVPQDKLGLDAVKSQALRWLIMNCEVSESVDVALQSIAGANRHFIRQPLEDCKATLQILKRLASSNLYKSRNARVAVELYSRALSALGPPTTTEDTEQPNVTQAETRENLEVMIWDLQALNENSVAGLITDGRFQSSAHNMEALRIGSTFASHLLQMLRSDLIEADGVFNSIVDLLGQHLNNDFTLHQSALVLLLNAAASLSLFLTDRALAQSCREFCRLLIQRERGSYSSELKTALITCGILVGQNPPLKLSRSETLAQGERNIRRLVDWQSANPKQLEMIFEVALLELLNHTEPPEINSEPVEYSAIITDYNDASINRLWISDPWPSRRQLRYQTDYDEMSEGAALTYLEAFRTLYDIVQMSTPRNHVYVFVVESMCLSSSSSLQVACGHLMDILPIPEPSTELALLLSDRTIASDLRRAANSPNVVQKFFAASQLWLLFIVQQSQASDTSGVLGREALLYHLAGRDSINLKQEEEQMANLTMSIWDYENSRGKIVAALGRYSYRLMECLLKSANYSVPQEILSGLCNVPKCHRGLFAMMGRMTPSTEEPFTQATTQLGDRTEADGTQMEYESQEADYETLALNEETDVPQTIAQEIDEYSVREETKITHGDRDVAQDERVVAVSNRDNLMSRRRALMGGAHIRTEGGPMEAILQDSRYKDQAIVNLGGSTTHEGHVSIEMLDFGKD